MGGHPLAPRYCALVPRLRSGRFETLFAVGVVEMSDRCPVCGASYALVGRAHLCRPVPVANKPAPPNGSPNKSGYSRNKRWREKHAEKYRAGQAELMRKRRAEGKGDAVELGSDGGEKG
jgi:hypothetical protein